MQLIKQFAEAAAHLFYPHTCAGCGSDLLTESNLLCARCYVSLPTTNYAVYANNPVEKIFWGRMPLVAASGEFYFAKGSVIQQLVHQLKYRGNQAIGVYLGELMGHSLLNSARFGQLDAIIPLPLNPRKEKLRGYNQAAVICKGVSEVMQVPVLQHVLVRQRFTSTQTRKHRAERWENVDGSFIVQQPGLIQGKHVLLVDDVITTGATFEASGAALIRQANVKLSIAALAVATK